ncbi:hypothetical protein FQN53_003563 [Emmonsiellopsis sp. PD_33]|nr:hypothetical protein FQN53_003563 [Emmonsiellopsis sp. PD_33]
MPTHANPPHTASGITTNALTGERHIPASLRPDGSQRREIRVRPGYRPPEDIQVYKNRTAEAWKNRGARGGIPGAEGLGDDTAAVGANNNKNAKKREAKKRAKAATTAAATGDGDGDGDVEKQEGGGGGALEKANWRSPPTTTTTTTTTTTKPANLAPIEVTVDPELEREKKARNLKKKLRQARELSEKKDNGESLLPEQFEKVIKIQELVRQLDALGFDAEGERKGKGGGGDDADKEAEEAKEG